MKQKGYKVYHVIRVIVKNLGNLVFGSHYIGCENIPKAGPVILAGNHTSNFDAYLLLASTKREIHFLGKKELFQGPFAFIFYLMHLIPVDRSKKNPQAIKEAITILEQDKVIGIFPEGTFHKTDVLLPFKPGVIHFAEKTNAPIIPFAITGHFGLRAHPTITFGKPIFIKDIKREDKVKYLEEVIYNMIIKKEKE